MDKDKLNELVHLFIGEWRAAGNTGEPSIEDAIEWIVDRVNADDISIFEDEYFFTPTDWNRLEGESDDDYADRIEGQNSLLEHFI